MSGLTTRQHENTTREREYLPGELSPERSQERHAGLDDSPFAPARTEFFENMAPTQSPSQHTFGLLPEEKNRFGSLGASVIVNVAIAAIALLLGMSAVHQAHLRKMQTTELIFPVVQPKPYIPPVPRVRVVAPPPTQPPKIKLPTPVRTPEPPKVAEIKMPTPELPRMAPAPPRRVVAPPQPKVGAFSSPHPTAVANNTVRPTVHTGGFGDPVGVTPNPNANRPANIAAVGAFNGSPGVGQPSAGSARPGSVHGVAFGSGVANGVPGGHDRGAIASAGFSDGVVGGTGPRGRTGTVAKASFGDNMFGRSTVAPRAQEPQSTSIVVLSKPLPSYTAEARQLHIEGDVTLQVRFTASGQVEVLRVVSGLGHGLDEQAKQAAERIRFKPATKDGHPVDQVSIIHITFQMT
jgi:TonB family protein